MLDESVLALDPAQHEMGITGVCRQHRTIIAMTDTNLTVSWTYSSLMINEGLAADANDDQPVRQLLGSYGQALGEGDLPAIADCYAYPSVIIGDDTTMTVGTPSQVKSFFGAAAEQYRTAGLATAHPEIERIDQLGSKPGVLWSVDVRWSNRDSDGAERATESHRYIVRRAGAAVAICAVIPRFSP